MIWWCTRTICARPYSILKFPVEGETHESLFQRDWQFQQEPISIIEVDYHYFRRHRKQCKASSFLGMLAFLHSEANGQRSLLQILLCLCLSPNLWNQYYHSINKFHMVPPYRACQQNRDQAPGEDRLWDDTLALDSCSFQRSLSFAIDWNHRRSCT